MMGDNFYKENKMNYLGMVGLEQTSVSSLGSDHLIPPATKGQGLVAVLFGTLLNLCHISSPNLPTGSFFVLIFSLQALPYS